MIHFLQEINKLLNWSTHVEIARKCLIVVSIVLLICDAVRYLKHYYTDSAFDNQVKYVILLIFISFSSHFTIVYYSIKTRFIY